MSKRRKILLQGPSVHMMCASFDVYLLSDMMLSSD